GPARRNVRGRAVDAARGPRPHARRSAKGWMGGLTQSRPLTRPSSSTGVEAIPAGPRSRRHPRLEAAPGGKCADINSLYVGLARAAGLPARDFFGIRVADSSVTKSLGKSGDITKAQHCRAEVYIEGKGWFPVDPADVRKVVLEEKIPADSDKVKALRERLFGNW